MTKPVWSDWLSCRKWAWWTRWKQNQDPIVNLYAAQADSIYKGFGNVTLHLSLCAQPSVSTTSPVPAFLECELEWGEPLGCSNLLNARVSNGLKKCVFSKANSYKRWLAHSDPDMPCFTWESFQCLWQYDPIWGSWVGKRLEKWIHVAGCI